LLWSREYDEMLNKQANAYTRLRSPQVVHASIDDLRPPSATRNEVEYQTYKLANIGTGKDDVVDELVESGLE
jgi:hypothetical protein